MYVKVDENGEYGFYTTEIHGEEFCKDNCLKITDECYEFLLTHQGEYLIDISNVDGEVGIEHLVKRPKEEPPFEPGPSEIDVLKHEVEQLREEKKMTDLALLELVELVLGGIEGGE